MPGEVVAYLIAIAICMAGIVGCAWAEAYAERGACPTQHTEES